MTKILSLIGVSLLALLAIALVFVEVAAAGPPNDACDLPKDLQQEVTNKYPGRTLVNFSDLNEDDRKLFRKEHADSCPGLVKVDFYGDGKPTLALALTTKSVAKGKTELVLARQVGAGWKTTTLDTTDGPVPVVWSEKPGEYKDVYGEKKILASKPVIVFCGYYSWAVLICLDRKPCRQDLACRLSQASLFSLFQLLSRVSRVSF